MLKFFFAFMIIIVGSEVSSQETWDPNNAEWHYNFKLALVWIVSRATP